MFVQAATCKLAVQLKGTVLPIRKRIMRCKPREVTDDERKYSVYEAMRIARADKKLIGVREKRQKAKADEEKLKKK